MTIKPKTQLGADLIVLSNMVETVRQAIATTGTSGIPSGNLYAMMMGFGCSKEVYDHLINALLETGKITKTGNILRSA